MISMQARLALAALFFLCAPAAAQKGDPMDIGKAVAANANIPFYLDQVTYLTGRVNPAEHPQVFRKLPKRLTDGRDHYLRTEAATRFEEMAEAARADGIALKVISSFRSYDYQSAILKRKVAGKPARDKIAKYLEFSALPGTSRHHWGTEVDLNALSNDHFKRGEGKRIFDWLEANARGYGFARPYTEGRPDGHKPEAWHWSYTPISKPLLAIYNDLWDSGRLTEEDLGPCAGELDVVERFVNGIAKELKPKKVSPPPEVQRYLRAPDAR